MMAIGIGGIGCWCKPLLTLEESGLTSSTGVTFPSIPRGKQLMGPICSYYFVLNIDVGEKD